MREAGASESIWTCTNRVQQVHRKNQRGEVEESAPRPQNELCPSASRGSNGNFNV